MSNERVLRFLHKTLLVVVVVLPLLATTYAVYLAWNRWVHWQDLAILAGMYVVSAVGIGIGYHRMLTHRGFEAPAPVRFVFMAMGSLALEGPAVEWAATHYKHHAKADQEGDPHSPLEGFWHAHLGWLFRDRMVKTGVWAKPFENDKVAHFVDRTFWVWAVLTFLIPATLGYMWNGWAGWWSGLLWGGLVRIALVHHVTWSVNSVCHTFGKRPYETKDESRNQWVVGLLALGEGWHNNHHASPQTAVHGFEWWQFDFNGIVIRTMDRLKMIRNVHYARPKPTQRPHGGGRRTPAPVVMAEKKA